MTRAEKQSLIRKAYDHNDAARRMASCNALYMGSMATTMLMSALGKRHGTDSLSDAINDATDEQLDAGLAQCANIIKYAKLVP